MSVAFATSAHAQASYSSGNQAGGDMTNGQSRSWGFNVPRGNYFAVGSVSYKLTSDTDEAKITCLIRHGNSSTFWDLERASVSGDAHGGHVVEGELTLLSQIQMPANSTLAIECYVEGGQTQRIYDVRLEMIAARAITELTPVDPGPALGPVRGDWRNQGGVNERGRN